MKPILEVCVDSIASAKAAYKGGADRLELCSALSVAGLTPSIGLLLAIKSTLPIPIFCMIRCRNGNFEYSPDEVDVMVRDIQQLKGLGADGFVFGAINHDTLNPMLLRSTVDVETCETLLKVAHPFPCTFHRAIDVCQDWKKAMERIINLGFTRILTSGLDVTAEQGIDTIADMKRVADARIIIMPGCGLNESNICKIQKYTKCDEFHASCSKLLTVPSNIVDETPVKETDSEMVKIFVTKLLLNLDPPDELITME